MDHIISINDLSKDHEECPILDYLPFKPYTKMTGSLGLDTY